MLGQVVMERASDYRTAFQSGDPFRHVCIEGFFSADVADSLLADFPTYDRAAAINEFGRVGGKAVNTDLPRISAFYARLSAFLISTEFMQQMSALTGIDGLEPDLSQFGGGTHENLDGQSLDPHIDFNFDSATRRHRRLNLLVYLNKDWDPAWGGQIELHKDPRAPATDRRVSFSPDFNRAVIFETNERSWHGFQQIKLPPGFKDRSRKCLSIYLYTRTRPEAEIAPPHGTFYVPRPLPQEISAGHTLTCSDMMDIEDRIARWSHWLFFHQARELQLSAQVEDLQEQLGTVVNRNRGVRHHAAAMLSQAAALMVALVRAICRPFRRPGHG